MENQDREKLKRLLGERFVSLGASGGAAYQLVFDRGGFSGEEQDKFLKNIRDEAAKILPASEVEKITFLGLEKNAKDVHTAPQAKLRVGHGPNAGKKRILGVKRTIAVSSAKGGVGKSTVSVNLAISLAQNGARVGLLDADIYGPSIPMMLGQRGAKPRGTEDKKIIPILAHGIKFISFGLFVEEKDPVIWRGPMLGGVLNQFLFDTLWEELDFLVLDLPPGTGDMQLSMVQNLDLDGAIIVSTPQEVALLDSIKGLNMFKQLGVAVIGMIENMSYFLTPSGEEYKIFGEGAVEQAALETEIPFLGKIPLEMEQVESSDRGVPFMAREELSEKKTAKAYRQIAKELEKRSWP